MNRRVKLKNRIRKDLLSWQWSSYFEKHRNRVNLLIHILVIPIFWVGIYQLTQSLIEKTDLWLGPTLIVLSFAAQGLGHKLEKENPEEFLGPVDFVSRFVAEQIITFPRFVLTGKWFKSFSDK